MLRPQQDRVDLRESRQHIPDVVCGAVVHDDHRQVEIDKLFQCGRDPMRAVIRQQHHRQPVGWLTDQPARNTL